MRVTRRSFLAAGASFAILPSVRGYAVNERLNLALVGVAGYANAAAFVPGLHLYGNVGVTALCDVDERRLAGVWKTWEERKGTEVYARALQDRPRWFPDYRKMLEGMGDRIDAVVVATPDHSHAVISAACLRAGKHVFAEKPLTITVREARALRELAAARKAATSMGNQGTQSGAHRRAVELVREGVLGDVTEVHVWFPRGGQNHREPPQGEQAVPPGLHWDLWQGPIAARPYHPRWIARNHWRETSAGELGNFGPHTANLPFRALNVAELWTSCPEPIRIRSEFSELNRLSFPRWELMRWKVPARGAMPPVTFAWHHAPQPGLPPGSAEDLGRRLRDYGVVPDAVLQAPGALMVGTKGALLTNSHNTDVKLLPEDRFRDADLRGPKTLPASRGHYQDWIHACRGGPAPWSSFPHSATFNEFLMLGPLSTRFEWELDYDPITGRILNHPEADRLLGYEYRSGWEL
jgi:hypothetical protein